MASASFNDGVGGNPQVFDPLERCEAKLADSIFHITRVYVNPAGVKSILMGLLPYVDAYLALANAEQAFVEIARREAEHN